MAFAVPVLAGWVGPIVVRKGATWLLTNLGEYLGLDETEFSERLQDETGQSVTSLTVSNLVAMVTGLYNFGRVTTNPTAALAELAEILTEHNLEIGFKMAVVKGGKTAGGERGKDLAEKILVAADWAPTLKAAADKAPTLKAAADQAQKGLAAAADAVCTRLIEKSTESNNKQKDVIILGVLSKGKGVFITK